MKTKYCKHCGKTKRVELFAKNGWCKFCMSKYLLEYKKPRLDFEATMLTEEDMRIEMRSIKKIQPKGLSALVDLTLQFEKAARSIKTFDSKVAVRNRYDQIIGFKTNILY